MDTRRDFIKKAALLGGGVSLWSTLPASIQKALAIDPQAGSTFYDAEHIVFLMQENRSFDHCFGTLQGVRGYNDPRAIQLPNKNKVWLQSDKDGNTFAPFRLDIKNTKSTWTGNLPHSWTNQTDARNHGRFDQWLEAKRSGYKEYSKMPLTLGYYNREDIPFYYALADAFTVCDQHFCSSLTGTTPNRLFFFTGSLRAEEGAQPNVDNGNVDYNHEAEWETFPQLLEENDISWKVYQNEISLDAGLDGTEDFWLGNFTDNPLEWFKQHRVRFSKGHFNYCENLTKTLPAEIEKLQSSLRTLDGEAKEKQQKEISKKQRQLKYALHEVENFSPEKFAALSQHEKNLHDKAFTTNDEDKYFHQLEAISYESDGKQKTMKAPKGDVFYQFRKDVNDGKLPAVSWLVAPQAFSDHPSAPWYGAWYVSEVMDILTKNPDVWKKTIFILNYDENDGYFDHIPPFVAPNPKDPETGKVAPGIDAATDFVSLEEDIKRVGEKNKGYARESPVGLGYRVPMIIASPWTRGGWVNSQVFDHTSSLRFLEDFLQKKTGKPIHKKNISSWRRAVAGNLQSVFRKFDGEKVTLPFVDRNPFLEGIQNAASKKLPDGYKLLNREEIAQINKNMPNAWMAQQEPGIRNACALPYELYADGKLSADQKTFEIHFTAGNQVFGANAAGAPFNVYAPVKYLQKNKENKWITRESANWSFAVNAGASLKYQWPVSRFENDQYHLNVYGPNGFFRIFSGNVKNAGIEVQCTFQHTKYRNRLSGAVAVLIENNTGNPCTIELADLAYKNPKQQKTLKPKEKATLVIPTRNSFGWYDFSVKLKNDPGFERRFAGRVETGQPSKTDPLMGKMI